MTARIRVILGDPGSVAGHPSGSAARDEVVAAGHVPGVELPGVVDIATRTGRSHPSQPFPGGSATVTVDVAQLGGTDQVRDISGRLIDSTLTAQTGKLLPMAWRPADSLVEFVTICADISWVGTDGSTTRRAWWPLFSGALRRITRQSGREGRDLLTLHVFDGSSWLGASTGTPISGTFTAWPQESVTDRLNRILTAAVYPTNRLTGGVVDPSTTVIPDGALPRLRRVQIEPETTRQVARIDTAPAGSLLAEARETVDAWHGDLFWHHGIGDISDRDALPATATMPSGAVVQTDWGDLLVLTGSALDQTVPSITRQGFASPVVFGHADPEPRPDGEGGVWAAYAGIVDDISATDTSSVAVWNRLNGSDILGSTAYSSEWIRRVGWRTDERSDTLHISDSDLRLAQEFYLLEFSRPRRIWRWETISGIDDSSVIATDRQLAQAMTALRHRVSLGVIQSSDTMTTAECHIEQVSHRIAGGSWTTSYTAVPASTAVELRGWSRSYTRRDTVAYVAAPTTPSSNTFSVPEGSRPISLASEGTTLWVPDDTDELGIDSNLNRVLPYDTTTDPPSLIDADIVIPPSEWLYFNPQVAPVVRTSTLYWFEAHGFLSRGVWRYNVTAEYFVLSPLSAQLTQHPITTITIPTYSDYGGAANGSVVGESAAARPGETTVYLLFARLVNSPSSATAYLDIHYVRRDAATWAETGSLTRLWSRASSGDTLVFAGAAATTDHLYLIYAIHARGSGDTLVWQLMRWSFAADGSLTGRQDAVWPTTAVDISDTGTRLAGLAAINDHLYVYGGADFHRVPISDLTFS